MVAISKNPTNSSPFFKSLNEQTKQQQTKKVFLSSLQSEIIISRGYPVEELHVTTEDGFILGLQRIPHGRDTTEPRFSDKPVVFLQHGILADATNWIMDWPLSSLAYILVDHGFDVWLGNIRGNDYSRRHVKYNPSQKEFWDWRYLRHVCGGQVAFSLLFPFPSFCFLFILVIPCYCKWLCNRAFYFRLVFWCVLVYGKPTRVKHHGSR